ncbi:MAG: FtsX-like permease family protein [Actinomycetales bacterium]|uniref:FtsX-like permease family protein n=1 Tax=Candidatus Phosphoribacter hodrii TaxID=2953743 RepID=A0A935M5V7_9MICO|nr:FtsX-like permease family protein [Candidatus Phosphoribacter hodrii]
MTSRQVLLNPPSREELALPDGVQSMADNAAAGQAITSAIMAIGLLLETTLLVGPAFAVSAARQRRTLALAASNGATTAQLRRTVLAQALVLGVLAALVGAVVGVLGAWAVIRWSGIYRPDTMFGPFDVPVLPVAIIVGCAVASAVIAAMIPSRGLGRLDIVAVMRGQSVSPPALVRTPIAGIVLAGLGAVGVFWAVAFTSGAERTWIDDVVPLVAMGGAIMLVIGALLLVPMVLVLAGRVARSAPVAIRMALRDAARQRGRATSTVAAILGGTALLSAILVVAASDTAYRAKTYVPQLPMGQALLIPTTAMDGSLADPRWTQNVTDIAHGIDPALQVHEIALVDVSRTGGAIQKPIGPESPMVMPFFVAVRTGCALAQALDMGAPKDANSPPDTSCLSLNGMGMGDARSAILVGTVAQLVQTYTLDATAEATLRAGGLVVAGDKAVTPTWTKMPEGGWVPSGPILGQVDIVDGRVSLARGTATYGSEAGPTLSNVTTLSLAATPVPAATLNATTAGVAGPSYGGMQMVGALMTLETAKSLALPWRPSRLTILDPRGPLSADAGAALSQSLSDSNLGWFYVERGFQPYDTVLAAIVLSFIGLIILVATLVSTALSTAETQSMMGTFAAVGATRIDPTQSRCSAGRFARCHRCTAGDARGLRTGDRPGSVLHALSDGVRGIRRIHTGSTRPRGSDGRHPVAAVGHPGHRGPCPGRAVGLAGDPQGPDGDPPPDLSASARNRLADCDVSTDTGDRPPRTRGRHTQGVCRPPSPGAPFGPSAARWSHERPARHLWIRRRREPDRRHHARWDGRCHLGTRRR